MRKSPRRFGKRRLHSRIFLICSLVMIIALLIACVVVALPTMRVISQDYIQTSQRDMALVSNALESTITHLANNAVAIATDSGIIRAAQQHPDGLGADAEDTHLRSQLSRDIRSMLGTNIHIFRYDILTTDGKPFDLCLPSYPYGLVDALPDNFFQDAANTYAVQIHGPYSIGASAYRLPVFIITKSIVNLDTREPYGVLMLAVRESRLSRLFSSGLPSSDVSFFVVNDNLDIVSGINEDQLNENARNIFDLTEPEMETLRRDGRLIAECEGSDTLFMLSDLISTRTDWRVLMATSMQRSQNAWRQIYANTIVLIAGTCLVLLLISYKLSRNITRPVNKLVDSIHSTTELSDLQPIPDPGGGYEVEILYKSYNELIEHIGELIEHVNQEQEEKSNYKFQLLQAQVKPHFLYNTLMTVKSLIDLDMNDTASECVYAMSSFYRLSLNKGNDILQMGDEIELSMQYMYIQKLRYIDRLDYVFDVPRSLYKYYVPKMTIQPILENAIYHGVKEKADKGVIEVKGCDLGDHMQFTITDNGCGMSTETLTRLRATIDANSDDISPRNESFGLYSVNRRIRMLYGESCGLYIDSRLGEYTTVTLVLPKNTGNGGIL